MTPAQHHAILIAKAISEARSAGVDVLLDWDEDEDGFHVRMVTLVHRRQESGFMKITDGPFMVEGY